MKPKPEESVETVTTWLWLANANGPKELKATSDNTFINLTTDERKNTPSVLFSEYTKVPDATVTWLLLQSVADCPPRHFDASTVGQIALTCC